MEALLSLGYGSIMPDDLYERDALAWSERQAALLRRVARGERVNDVDWDHVVEEIEDVGRSELHAVEWYVEQLLALLLRLRGWPELRSRDHWRGEIVTSRAGAARGFAPSMRQRIDLEGIYRTAVRQIEPRRYGGRHMLTSPATCPVTLDQMLSLPRTDLEAAFSSPP